ncbi:putative ABC transport system ATP-binding protein [Actinoplanes octamycinicus]|uniref:Putative ABC transport system ATP-binding protein n=1 Tax=Actinoplanes octamycinicus TaxID=135948 RepID=A0A7W7H043_9ACTN|nr:ABC transporter ATP-binding protein [Actinoplanes octamycinicus]MBB4741521.1 putative ABC transport system ATP-binding protein [Actinoplanes octamycinicus]GIE57071.1 peptide ABC transporter ATP-binding protein [Actinoplanes octamycinicus]
MTPVVEFAGVTRAYPGPPPVQALRAADLVVGAGEYVAVTGPSGSGKSTFLNVVGLLDRPTAGVYRLDGIDTATLPERDRTALRGRRIGFVFQSFHLLRHRSVVENVTMAMVYTGVARPARAGLALETLERVGLTHRAHARAGHLSGGESQRVAIARALVNRPSLLLCDEPTGNLDSASAAAVLALIEELNDGGLTVLMVTHDQQVAGRAHRSVLIKDGILR